MMNTNELVAHLRIRSAIAFPNYDDIWQEGFDAGSKNLSEATNPYDRNSKNSDYWSDGWWAAFYEEEPLFTPQSLSRSAPTVADISIKSANDASIRDQKTGSLYTLIFSVLLSLFASLVIYTVYDFAT